jgi:acyl-CoA dehydrogenase
MDFEPSARTAATLERARAFLREHVEPVEAEHAREVREANPDGNWRAWTVSPRIEELKSRARAAGLWNLFLPDPTLGAGLTTLEYAPVAELTGRSFLAPEVFNCSAPDTGNMEVLWRFGTAEQKRAWLEPLLDGRVRSVFAMTEPDVASSDATNLQGTAVVSGDEVVVDARKWWCTGLGDPRAAFAIVLARTPDASADRHHQHSMVVVPLDAPGVEIVRMLPVYGSYDAPSGHGEVVFRQVRVPAGNLIGGPGKGYEIAQGRLGPGRIHHCMRCIGAAERALEMMVDRGVARTAFGKPIMSLGGNRERLADLRVAIDQARLLTLHAAWKLDRDGAMAALADVSAIKLVAPSLLQRVVDAAVQMHGGAGMADETLTGFFAQARALRIADGPDEVHRGLIAKVELLRHEARRAAGR